MERDAKRLFPLAEHERRELVQRFCLALRNTQVYGADHTVSASSFHVFFDLLIGLLDRFPEVEFCQTDGTVLLNGQACDLRMADDVLANRMRSCELAQFAFLDSLTRADLKRFLVYLSTGKKPPERDEEFVGIRISGSLYARISENDLPVEHEKVPVQNPVLDVSQGGAGSISQDSMGGIKLFDLDSMLAEEQASSASGVDALALQYVNGFVAQKRLVDQEREKLVDAIRRSAGDAQRLAAFRRSFLAAGGEERDWETLCRMAGALQSEEQRGSRDHQIHQLLDQVDALRVLCESGQLDSCSVGRELEKLRGSLDGLMDLVHTRADSLVEKVDADRLHVAAMEERARASGAPLHLSREELLASLAEINQELAQPLTVSSALLELLSSGKLGPVEAKQQELVTVATGSLARLEAVVKYLQRLSGVPVSLSPDQGLLSEVYSDADR